jgi:hypothetical protein
VRRSVLSGTNLGQGIGAVKSGKAAHVTDH